MIDERLRNVIVAVVTFCWAMNLIVPVFAATYDPDPAVHAVFMAIVGGTLALSRKGGTDGDGPT